MFNEIHLHTVCSTLSTALLLVVLAGCVGEAFSASGSGGGGADASGGAGGAGGSGGEGAAGPVPVKWPDSATARCTNGTRFLENGSCPGQSEPFFGQDGFYRIAVPEYDEGDGVVNDSVTGLMWEKGVDVHYSHAGAREHCSALKAAQFKGHSDWRLPTRRELVSITDFGHSKAFPDVFATFDGFYWTQTDVAIDPTRAWVVKSDEGALAYILKTDAASGRAMCVRGEPVLDVPEYAVGSEVVTDLTTGLVWQVRSQPTQLDWAHALDFCEKLGDDKPGEKSDWRLPSVKELLTLVDDRESGPAVDKQIFPGVPTDGFWSSTPAISARDTGDQAIAVYFVNGLSQGGTVRDAHYLRCVRSD